MPIPAQSAPPPAAPPPPPPAGGTDAVATGDPFAGGYAIAPPSPRGSAAPAGGGFSPPPPSSDNPYQSPLAWGPEPGAAGYEAKFAPQRVDLSFVLSAAWGIFRDRMSLCLTAFVVLIGVNIVMMLLLQGSMVVAQSLPAAGQLGLSALGQIASNLLSLWINLGMIRMFLALARGQHADLSLIFTGGPYLLRAIVATILFMFCAGGLMAVVVGPLVGVAVLLGFNSTGGMAVGAVGLVLGVVLGTYLLLGLMMYQYCLVDQDAGIIESLQMSWRLAAGNRLTLLLLMIVLAVLGAGGVLCLCVGIVFTASYGWLAMAVAYLLMSGQGVIRPQTWN